MSPPVISAENLGKRYSIGAGREKGTGRYRRLSEELVEFAKTPFQRFLASMRGTDRNVELVQQTDAAEFWALRNVSFDVKEGEVLGVIGRNGAGKSTLLKILSRITEPTEGVVTLRGRVASLLEVGTGFHPELTGRENIYLNGAILGMSRNEIRAKFDEIVEFAEVEPFIDTAIKRYSSGMQLRLAFAVAAHLEPEILAVDEVLAVGDLAFQRKSFRRMSEISSCGRTVIVVSHNLALIESLCERVIVLDHGRVQLEAETKAAITMYTAGSVQARADVDCSTLARGGDGRAKVSRVVLNDGRPSTIHSGEDLRIRLFIESNAVILRSLQVAVAIYNSHQVAALITHSTDEQLLIDVSGTACIEVVMRELPLAAGEYSIHVGLGHSANALQYDHIVDVTGFTVDAPAMMSHHASGLVRIRCDWRELPLD
jgi:lipopolysaccharide transport system ATP-binding protein